MRTSLIMGAALLLVGIAILYLLKGPLIRFIILVLELLGVFVGFLFLLAGIALIVKGFVWRARGWASQPTRLSLDRP